MTTASSLGGGTYTTSSTASCCSRSRRGGDSGGGRTLSLVAALVLHHQFQGFMLRGDGLLASPRMGSVWGLEPSPDGCRLAYTYESPPKAWRPHDPAKHLAVINVCDEG